MFIKLIIISTILVGIIMLTLGIKLLFNPQAEFSVHSCSSEPDNKNEIQGCGGCELKDLADCSDKKK